MYARLIAAVAVTVSAMVHLKMWFDGARDQSVGPAFMLNAIGGVVIAVLLLTWKHWAPPLLAVGFGLSTLGAFTIATTVGLFGVHDQWVGGYVWTAAAAEAVAVGAGLFAARGVVSGHEAVQASSSERSPDERQVAAKNHV